MSLNTAIALLLLFNSILINADSSEDLKLCLKELISTAEVITSRNERYNELSYHWNFRTYVAPQGFIVAYTSTDVQKSVICAQKLNIHLVPKCGGHSFEKISLGFGNNDAWVIDLTNLNHVIVEKRKMIATIGSGLRFQNLSKALWNGGKLGVPIGMCFSVGISGFSLGGGFGAVSRKYGLMIDSIEEIEIVVASGKILKASVDQNSDLFWALRGGGGGNFGIVTQFKIKMFDASLPSVVVVKHYEIFDFVTFFTIWQKWLQSNPSNSVNSFFRVSEHSEIVVFFIIMAKNFQQCLFEVEIIRQTFPSISYEDFYVGSFMDMLETVSVPDYKKTMIKLYAKTKSFFVSKILNEYEIRILYSLLNKYPFINVVVEMLGGRINDVNSSATAFYHRSAFYSFQFSFYLPHTDEKTVEIFTVLIQRLTDFNENLKFMDSGHSYVNYLDLDISNWQTRYYGKNYDRLKEVKKTYDPNNFFKFPQSIEL